MPEYKKQGVALVAISADSQEDSAAYINDKGITVPLLSDPDLKVIKAYGVAMAGQDIAVPSTFIIGPDKTIHWKYVGENMTDRPSERDVLNLALKTK